MTAFFELLLVAGAAILLLMTGRANKANHADPAPRETMRCPSCGSAATVRGGHWECPYCGDSGRV